MRKMLDYQGWGIYENSSEEVRKHGFKITVLHPVYNMKCPQLCSPSDSSYELDTFDAAVAWIQLNLRLKQPIVV